MLVHSIGVQPHERATSEPTLECSAEYLNMVATTTYSKICTVSQATKAAKATKAMTTTTPTTTTTTVLDDGSKATVLESILAYTTKAEAATR